MKNGFDNECVQDIEIELVGNCNLKCPLCSRRVFPNRIGSPNSRPLNDWIEQIDRYKSLKSVAISGICSEPTLYPDLLKLIDYFVNRDISIELFTNASTHNEEWWIELSKHLTEDDLVIFTICGSTQEIHEKYRVGQSLETMLKNAFAFKHYNKYKNDCMQHIMFEYNKKDFEKNMKPILSKFSKNILITTPPYAERFSLNRDNGICVSDDKYKKYMTIVSEAMRRRNRGDFEINCRSKRLKYLSIDQFGNEYPCFLYRLFSNKSFDKSDFSEIESFKFDFCYDCDVKTSKMLDIFGIESMI